MKIVADSNIPFAKEACAAIGEVETVEASELSPERLRDCDILLCRSTRKINAELLDGTAVRFVATATIGVDHVDVSYLESRGIGFASAPGSNANSVSEYVTSALLVLASQTGRRLRDLSIGVIGIGNVGSRVVRKAEALGMTVRQNDPPLRRRTGEDRFRPIEELMDADVLTLHVPLLKTGQDATMHMVDRAFLARMKPGAMLINSSRGAVVDGGALHEAIDSGRLGGVVLDVWENEPDIDRDLLAKVSIGTPHIAGHSFDGKVNGTKMVVEAACRFLGIEPAWNPASVMPPPDVPCVEVDARGRDDEDAIREVVLALYDVRLDDVMLREAASRSSGGDYFNALRRGYWRRREFHNTRVELTGGSPRLVAAFSALGSSMRIT